MYMYMYKLAIILSVSDSGFQPEKCVCVWGGEEATCRNEFEEEAASSHFELFTAAGFLGGVRGTLPPYPLSIHWMTH